MKTIYKFDTYHNQDQRFEGYEVMEFLHVNMQRGQVCVWARVETESPRCWWRIKRFGTGHNTNELSQGAQYIGTMLANSGDLVWHYFADREQ
jgi:hypothetical protein